jgi:hypothetical protein
VSSGLRDNSKKILMKKGASCEAPFFVLYPIFSIDDLSPTPPPEREGLMQDLNLRKIPSFLKEGWHGPAIKYL